MSALDFEEAGHKLMKIQVDPGREIEVSAAELNIEQRQAHSRRQS